MRVDHEARHHGVPVVRRANGNCIACGNLHSRAWIRANPERNRATVAAWKKAHPERNRALKRASRRRIAAAKAREQARTAPRSFMPGLSGDNLTRVQKLEKMAAQTASPFEAAIAQRMLETTYAAT